MADGMQVSLSKTDFTGAVLLEYFVWNDANIHTVIIHDNNFVFGNEPYIIKSLTIKKNYGVILNQLPFVIYTSTNTKNLPVTVRAIRIFELSEKDQQQNELYELYKKNKKIFFIFIRIII